MPTGYTAPVVDGEVTELKEFVWRCARAFGALVYLAARDRLVKNLDQAQSKLTWWQNASDAEVLEKMGAENAESQAANEKHLAERNQELERLNAMRAKVEGWEPPTEEHVNLKKFMLEQLDISKPLGEPYLQTIYDDPKEFRAKKISQAEWSVNYHTEHLAKERENNRGREEWVEQLAQSLEDT